MAQDHDLALPKAKNFGGKEILIKNTRKIGAKNSV